MPKICDLCDFTQIVLLWSVFFIFWIFGPGPAFAYGSTVHSPSTHYSKVLKNQWNNVRKRKCWWSRVFFFFGIGNRPAFQHILLICKIFIAFDCWAIKNTRKVCTFFVGSFCCCSVHSPDVAVCHTMLFNFFFLN